MKRWLQQIETWANRNRPLALLAMFALSVAAFWLIDWLLGGNVYQRMFYPAFKTTADARAWSSISYTVMFVIGLPVAFLLWHWRDVNVREQIDNARKDITLKEFQEIQVRAAGALDEKLPEAARQTMQIAAIHQLRPFLRGEFGPGFRRPAWELLKARLETSARECGTMAITEWTETAKPNDGESGPAFAARKGKQIKQALSKVKPGPVTLAARALLAEDAAHLFTADLPLAGGRYDGAHLQKAQLAVLDLRGASFVGADMTSLHLEHAQLMDVHLEHADLTWAHLNYADLTRAHLECANLTSVDLERAILTMAHLEHARMIGTNLEYAKLFRAHLENANLTVANLEHADLTGAHLDGANLRGAWFNDQTRMTHNWNSLSPEQRAEHHQKLRDLGARHVDDPEPETGKP